MEFINRGTEEVVELSLTFFITSDNTYLLFDWTKRGEGVLVGSPHFPWLPFLKSRELLVASNLMGNPKQQNSSLLIK